MQALVVPMSRFPAITVASSCNAAARRVRAQDGSTCVHCPRPVEARLTCSGDTAPRNQTRQTSNWECVLVSSAPTPHGSSQERGRERVREGDAPLSDPPDASRETLAGKGGVREPLLPGMDQTVNQTAAARTSAQLSAWLSRPFQPLSLLRFCRFTVVVSAYSVSRSPFWSFRRGVGPKSLFSISSAKAQPPPPAPCARPPADLRRATRARSSGRRLLLSHARQFSNFLLTKSLHPDVV